MEPAKRENLDRILGAEEELAPSSGFVSAVMERVRKEASAPEPIPFPWRRALPGALVACGGLVWISAQVARQGFARLPDLSASTVIRLHIPEQFTGTLESAGWLAAALGVSLLSWMLARRMIGRSGMI